MDTSLKAAYDAHQKELAISYSVLETAKYEGRVEGKLEGKAEGKLEGKAEGNKEVVINGFKNDLSISILANITSLSESAVKQILLDAGLINE